MAKLSAIIAALLLTDAGKPLGEELGKTFTGPLAEIDSAELVTRLTTAETQNTQFAAQVKTLGEGATAAEALKTRVTALEGEKRTALINASFAAEAVKHGINKDAVSTAMRLADVSKLEVDIDKGTVGGLTKEMFDGLKTANPILATQAPAAIPPAPAGSGGAPNVEKYTQADFAAGRVDAKDVLSGKIQLQ